MLKDLLSEVYHLVKFKKAIKKTNLGEAATHLEKHRTASDAVEAHIKTSFADARADMQEQKRLMDNLVEKL